MSQAVLIFAYGNVSRGDDALAPLLLEQMQQSGITQIGNHPVHYLSDYQIQIEHVTDMTDCVRILLIDADQTIDFPYDFYAVKEQQQTGYTTHGMTPSTLLHTFHQVYNQSAPLTSMLAIRGVSFELGQGLSSQAEINLHLAKQFLQKMLSHKDFTLWDSAIQSSQPGYTTP